MTQPQWKCIANLGDVNPVEHGGMFVLIDETGKHDPQLEVNTVDEGELDCPYCGGSCPEHDDDDSCDGWQGDIDGLAQNSKPWTVYRFDLEKCTYVNGVLSDNRFHPDHPTWFADKIGDIANANGETTEQLIERLCSDDPTERACGYISIGLYYGWGEFDHYPLTFNLEQWKELKERFAKYKTD